MTDHPQEFRQAAGVYALDRTAEPTGEVLRVEHGQTYHP